MAGDVLQITVPGVIAGGTTGQLLAKASNADRDTEWIDAPSGLAGDVVGGRLSYVSTTSLKWAFVDSNQIRLWDEANSEQAIVECASEPTLSSTANDMNADAMTYAVIYDVFAKYSNATTITLEVAKWAVSTQGSSARTAAWVTSTAYKKGQRVSKDGSYYPCLEAHTSGTFATDLAANKWGPAMTGTADFLGLDIGSGGYPIYSNTGAWRGYRWLGIIITYNDTGSKFRNTDNDSSIGNYYNPIPNRHLSSNSTVSWSYTSASYRERNAGTGQTRGNFVLATTQRCVASIATYGAGSAGNVYLAVVGIDSTTAVTTVPRIGAWTYDASNKPISCAGTVILTPGNHYLTELEYGSAGATGGGGNDAFFASIQTRE